MHHDARRRCVNALLTLVASRDHADDLADTLKYDARSFAFIAQWHERALGMGEAPGSTPGEGSTVVGDYPLAQRSAEPSDQVPSPMRGCMGAVAELGKPAAAGRKSWALSGCGAAGSAFRCQREGRGFDPRHPHHAPLAQLVEASDLGSEGSRFESGEGYTEEIPWPVAQLAEHATVNRVVEGSTPSGPAHHFGGLAQLVERLLCKQDVGSSNLPVSTSGASAPPGPPRH